MFGPCICCAQIRRFAGLSTSDRVLIYQSRKMQKVLPEEFGRLRQLKRTRSKSTMQPVIYAVLAAALIHRG